MFNQKQTHHTVASNCLGGTLAPYLLAFLLCALVFSSPRTGITTVLTSQTYYEDGVRESMGWSSGWRVLDANYYDFSQEVGCPLGLTL